MFNSAKNKIYLVVFVWIILSLAISYFVFKKLGASNQTVLDEIGVLKKDEARLEAERQSFLQAKDDLEKLAAEKIQPENFFSQDITLVNEIRRLEKLAQDLGLKLTLSGISGTLKTATKAGTNSEIFQIPYSIQVQGNLDKVVSFLEYLENLEYITAVNVGTLSAADGQAVNASFNAAFYLKK